MPMRISMFASLLMSMRISMPIDVSARVPVHYVSTQASFEASHRDIIQRAAVCDKILQWLS